MFYSVFGSNTYKYNLSIYNDTLYSLLKNKKELNKSHKMTNSSGSEVVNTFKTSNNLLSLNKTYESLLELN